MVLDLSGGAGNLVVVGAQQSGKSTFVRTLLMSLALTHTPREVQFYCLDFGGGALTSLAGLPHVGGVATRRDVDRVRRTVAEIAGVLAAREGRSRRPAWTAWPATAAPSARAASPTTRTATCSSSWTGGARCAASSRTWSRRWPSWSTAASASACTSSSRRTAGWTCAPPSGTCSVRRSSCDSATRATRSSTAARPSTCREAPGRGLTADGFHFLTGLPRVDDRTDVETLGTAVAELVGAIRSHWSQATAPAVRLLPAVLPYELLPAARPGMVPIGIAETDLQPVHLDFSAEPHVLLFGDVEIGKSSFLKVVAEGIVRAHDPSQARIIMVDLRRSLLGTVEDRAPHRVRQLAAGHRGPHPPGHHRDEGAPAGPRRHRRTAAYPQLVARPRAVRPGRRLRPRRRREPEPAVPAARLPGQARDIGLHVVLTRRMGGAGGPCSTR